MYRINTVIAPNFSHQFILSQSFSYNTKMVRAFASRAFTSRQLIWKKFAYADAMYQRPHKCV